VKHELAFTLLTIVLTGGLTIIESVVVGSNNLTNPWAAAVTIFVIVSLAPLVLATW
jgi:hypothetical protein